MSGNFFWHVGSAAFLEAIRQAIDSTSEESQYWSFRQTLDGGVHDFVSRVGVIESIDSVDKTSPPVISLLLRRFCDILQKVRKLEDIFRQFGGNSLVF